MLQKQEEELLLFSEVTMSWNLASLRKHVRGLSAMGQCRETMRRPPNKNRIVRVDIIIRGILFYICDCNSIIVDELYMNSMNVGQ